MLNVKLISKRTILACLCAGIIASYYLYDAYQLIPHVPGPKFNNAVTSEFDVHTHGCQISKIDPFNEEVLAAVSPESVNCTTGSKVSLPHLVTVQRDVLQINPKILSHNYEEVKCCYEQIVRVQQDATSYDKSADNQYRTEGNCIEFTTGDKIPHSFIRVRCHSEGLEIYKNFFAYPYATEKVAKKMLANTDKEKGITPFSVLMIGADSVSRASTRRIMPECVEYLQEKGAIEFKGYTKVGENTLPNFSALFMGYFDDQLPEVCWPEQYSKFDDCPFIWKEYSDRGFVTAYAEDETSIGTFNYHKTGFVEQPTDFYSRTMLKAAEEELQLETIHSLYVCLGERLGADIVNRYALDFVRDFRDHPYFTLFWTNSITHNNANTAYAARAPYYRFLRELFEGEGMSDALDNTIVIFFSDHGMRFGKVRETTNGWMEESLPMLFWWFPPRFHQQHPQAVENMRQNAERLTSPFDVYTTLRAIMNQEFGMSSSSAPETSSEDHTSTTVPKRPGHGRNLFRPISPNRTCEQAGIPETWCMCHNFVKIDPFQRQVQLAARVILKRINYLLSQEVKCVTLYMNSIRSAYIYDGKKDILLYSVTIDVSPSGAIFQSQCAYESDKWEMNVVGEISRINEYGNQSWCVTNTKLKLYCFCNVQ